MNMHWNALDDQRHNSLTALNVQRNMQEFKRCECAELQGLTRPLAVCVQY